MAFLAIFLISLGRAYFEFHWFAIHLFLFIYLETAMTFTLNASPGEDCPNAGIQGYSDNNVGFLSRGKKVCEKFCFYLKTLII